jgi:hypothetical protein
MRDSARKAVTSRERVRELGLIRDALELMNQLEALEPQIHGPFKPLSRALAEIRQRYADRLKKHDDLQMKLRRPPGRPTEALSNLTRTSALAVEAGESLDAVVDYVVTHLAPDIPYWYPSERVTRRAHQALSTDRSRLAAAIKTQIRRSTRRNK